jgi:hypothetical protein
MVTVATALDELYPADDNMDIPLKGFVSGNYGSFNRHWLKANDGDEYPACGYIHAAGASGEDMANLWGQNAEDGQGVLGWDKTQIATNETTYTANDLIPCYPFAENPGMYFQGRVADTNGNWNAGGPIDAGAAGVFETGDYANKIYAFALYYIADTTATAQNLVMKVATGGHGG